MRSWQARTFACSPLPALRAPRGKLPTAPPSGLQQTVFRRLQFSDARRHVAIAGKARLGIRVEQQHRSACRPRRCSCSSATFSASAWRRRALVLTMSWNAGFMQGLHFNFGVPIEVLTVAIDLYQLVEHVGLRYHFLFLRQARCSSPAPKS